MSSMRVTTHPCQEDLSFSLSLSLSIIVCICLSIFVPLFLFRSPKKHWRRKKQGEEEGDGRTERCPGEHCTLLMASFVKMCQANY